MIMIRCACGKVLADKEKKYLTECAKLDEEESSKTGPDGKTKVGVILDDLGITKMCCRTVMMTTYREYKQI
jgi:DNA-directed RNA polymerase subunit N (RpoN/RPB10)